ncbi:MAG: RNA polymerase subunit sigma-24 [Actinomycetota bacterium]|nr:RNA polymerase subunit sigma-24 [Actinomycetota bacterium]
MTSETNTERALTAAWRDEWGRLLALLVAQYRRLELAEDGLGDAFEIAARTWSRDGAPANAAGWLLTVARRRVIDRLRSEVVASKKLPMLAVEADLQERAEKIMSDAGEVFDERLRLVLLCAHPALAPESAAALTLRLVLGVSTEDIARLFLVSTPTMAARLTRARKRLAGARFDLPEGDELVERVTMVTTVAYLAFTTGYAPGSGAEVLRAAVAAEAIRLVRVLRSALTSTVGDRLLPVGMASELDALLALMLLQHARRDARISTTDGTVVLLPEQDRSRWHHEEIDEALGLLTPHVLAPAAPYLLEALIAAEHAVARDASDTDWPRISTRYAELEGLTSSPVVRLNRAVAVAEADGPLAGLALLEGLDLPGHRLPATRAELLARAGRTDEARTWFTTALGLCRNGAERAHLASRLAALE